jgi:hypothetical protein
MRRITEELKRALAAPGGEGPHPLSHPVRREVLYHFSGNPCSTASRIARLVGVSTRTSQWHAAKLMTLNLLEKYVRGERERYYVPGSILVEDIPLFEALQMRGVRRAISLLYRYETLLSSDLAGMRGRSSVYRGIGTLMNLGFVSATSSGRTTGYWLSEAYFVKRERYRERVGDVAAGFLDLLSATGLNVVSSEIIGDELIAVVERATRFSVNLVVNPLERILEELRYEGSGSAEEDGG